MRFSEEEVNFIKTHQGMLKRIVENRMQDYFNKVVDEPDPQRKEVLSLLVRELRMALVSIGNISNLKETEKSDFTGL